MNRSEAKRWLFLFSGILAAILVANGISGAILNATGLSGPAAFIAGFVIYALFFFAVLYAIERIFAVRLFGI